MAGILAFFYHLEFLCFFGILLPMKPSIFFLTLLTVFTWALPVRTAMTSTNYNIFADSVSGVDVGPVTSSNYTLYNTIGEVGVTTTPGSTYQLRAGFQAMELGGLSATVSPSSISLGALVPTAVATSGVAVTVTTDSGSGYTVSLAEDGNLRSGSNTIDDVSDGSVTAGSEEYGIRTSGSSGLLTSDTAISGTVYVASAATEVTADLTTVIFSAAVTSTTQTGSYAQQVTFTIAINP